MTPLEKLLEKYPDKFWNRVLLSGNLNMTIEYIYQNLDKPWDWESLSLRPDINMKTIEI